MVESYVETKRSITLALNDEEASWLKDTLQNPISSDEDEDDHDIRKEIFDALKHALGK